MSTNIVRNHLQKASNATANNMLSMLPVHNK